MTELEIFKREIEQALSPGLKKRMEQLGLQLTLSSSNHAGYQPVVIADELVEDEFLGDMASYRRRDFDGPQSNERRQAKSDSLADKLTVEAKILVDLKIEKAAVEAERRKVEATIPMIMPGSRKANARSMLKCGPIPSMEKAVQQPREKIDGVSELFTLDICRHDGMTELEESELTGGQGRALSGHKTGQAYRCYAKETMKAAGGDPHGPAHLFSSNVRAARNSSR